MLNGKNYFEIQKMIKECVSKGDIAALEQISNELLEALYPEEVNA